MLTTFTATLRHFQRHYVYVILSISGLVIGLVTAMLIFMWSLDELSYDHQHPDNNRVFEIMVNQKLPEGQIATLNDGPSIMAEYLKNEIPEVEVACRTGYWERPLFTNGEKSILFDGRFGDSTFFRVFNLKIIAGNPKHPMTDDKSIVISQKMAAQLFENGDALGKPLTVNNTLQLKVTAIFEDYPRISSLSEEFIMPISFHLKGKAVSWDDMMVSTFVKLKHADDDVAVYNKIHNKLNEVHNFDFTEIFLFRLTDWRLHLQFVDGKMSGGRITYVRSFSLVALFILVMACINYVNLSTARAATRAKEVGIRKISGATQLVLARQFFVESLLFIIVAMVISLLIVYLSLPWFYSLTGKPLEMNFNDGVLLLLVFATALFTSIAAGSYPALMLSSLKPALILKGNLNSALSGTGLRKGLVIFQFSLSVILIFGAAVVYKQISYLREKDLGYDRHNIMYIQPPRDSKLSVSALRTDLLRNHAILAVSESSSVPFEINGVAIAEWPGKPPEPVSFNGVDIDYDYLPTLGFTIVQGRNFSREFADSANFVVTESAVKRFGFANPIGQTIEFWGRKGQIVGIVKDFHNAEIHEMVTPVVFVLGHEGSFGYWRKAFIRYEPGTLKQSMTFVKEVYKKYESGIAAEIGFLDNDFEYQYRSDQLIGKLAVFFTVVAITIACIGLFGLTLFSTQRRTKEIGIRKVLGASVSQVMLLLGRDFARPIALSILLAFPLGWYLAKDYLEAFPYHASVDYGTFAVASVTLLLLAVLTVSYQAFMASVRNPVETLRTE